MDITKGETYTDEPVQIDGKYFFGCKFIRCTLVYNGGDPCSFEKCEFDNPQFFFGGAAGNTMAFLHNMYQTPFRPMIEQTFENIKRNQTERMGFQNDGTTGNEQ